MKVAERYNFDTNFASFNDKKWLKKHWKERKLKVAGKKYFQNLF